MAVVQVGEQAGLSGFPAEGPARDEVGLREVRRDRERKEPEESRQHQYVRGNTHGGHAQTAANGLGDPEPVKLVETSGGLIYPCGLL